MLNNLIGRGSHVDFPLENICTYDVGAFYSLKKGRRNFNGALFSVQRSSDSTAQDIYGNPDGSLDTVSLLAFVGAGSGFIKTWYNQTGNFNHLTQSTVANMPRIVASGVIETKDCCPAIRFRYTGATAVSKLLNTSMTGLALQSTVFVVGSLETTQTYIQVILDLYYGGTRNYISHAANTNGIAATIQGVANTSANPYSLGSIVCSRMMLQQEGANILSNKVNDSSNLTATAALPYTPTSVIIGDDSTGGNDFYGYISEILIGKNMTIANADWVQACLMRRYIKGGLYSDGVDGANKFAYLADRAEYKITGNISAVIKIRTADLTLIASRSVPCAAITKTTSNAVGTDGEFNFGFRNAGGMYAIGNGGVSISNAVPINSYPFTWCKFLHKTTSGSSFYYSNDGVTYTLLTNTQTATGNNYTSTQPIRILGATYNTGRNAPVTLGFVKLYNGLIDGPTNDELSATKVLDINFDSYPYNTTSGITNSVFGDAVTLSNVQII